MPTYTILGTTGNTGNSLLTLLLQKHPDVHVNAYVRSKAKLLDQFPDLESPSNSKRVTIFTGGIDDPIALSKALRSRVDVVFCVTGAPGSTPGMRIAQDSAQGLVAAISHLRFHEDAQYRPPKLIFLSSATINERVSASTPWLVHEIVFTSLNYAYQDLMAAEKYMRLHQSWLDATFVQPGALTTDTQKGHRLSRDDCSSFVSYLDLAAVMIEISGSGEYEWEGVSVVGTAKDIRFEPNAPKEIARGLLFYLLPWTYPIARKVGLM